MTKRSRTWHAVFWPLLAVGLVLVLLALGILVTNLMIIEGAKAHIVPTPEQAPHAQCAIILGAKVSEDGTPSRMLADRIATGVALYKLGKVDKLLLSGDSSKQTPYGQVELMLRYVLAQGVPEEDVFTDYGGYTTWDTMYRAAHLFQVKTALIVTQHFHLSRSVYLARHFGLDAIGVVADIQTYDDLRQNAAREILARVKAVLLVYFAPPHTADLGGPYPITGDGRSSRQERID